MIRTSMIIFGLVMILSVSTLIHGAENVMIKNDLGHNKKLTLHCQSKNDDLGKWEVSDGNEFHWQFGVRIFGGTLFYCTIWQGEVQGFVFDAYTQGRDHPWGKVLWSIRDNGIFGYHSFNVDPDIFIPWPKKN
ncbi:hypothetical protein MLD38_015693 [Melastoma candidum]|uniref:Uncharacterized protein n=1 Tax=Melastoma candidum TaxID=119954 RepID=A0ACB9RQE8_9MYRT|nr:hypothetical protein MLD38_015693 [Melastoma candidum]